MFVDDVTIVIKTFERPMYLAQLVDSVRAMYPNLPVLVADDSSCPSPIDGVQYYCMPYDCGASAGRNLLVSQVKTKYFVLLDDDFHFTPNTKLERFYDIIENNDIDLLGGVVKPTCPDMHANIIMENRSIKFVSNPDGRRLQGDFCRCDFVLDFFMANTARFKKHAGWDNELKIAGEHLDLFLNMRGNMKVAFTDQVSIEHARNIPISADYTKKRRRDHRQLVLDKYDVDSIVTIAGITISRNNT